MQTQINQLQTQNAQLVQEISKLNQSVVFTAFSNVSTTIPLASWTLLPFQQVVDDTSNAYNVTSGIYKIPLDGYYHLETTVTITMGTLVAYEFAIGFSYQGTSMYLNHNGETSGSSEAVSVFASMVQKFYQGDAVNVLAALNCASPKSIDASNPQLNRFSIFKVG